MEKVICIEGGHKRAGEWFKCVKCDKNFIRRLNPPNGRIKSQYCGKHCVGESRKEKVTLSCSTCGGFFEVKKSQRDRSKSGHLFCSKKCKDLGQQVGSGLEGIHPDHYGSGSGSYRIWAKRSHIWACVDCGLDFSPLLNVHHIDRNRQNNVSENLEVLCAQHHAIRHMEWNGEKWISKRSALTPRDKLSEIRDLIRNSSRNYGGVV